MVVRKLSVWTRIKLWLAGIALASLAIGVLIFVLTVGSIIAVVLWIVFVLAVAGFLVKAAFQKMR